MTDQQAQTRTATAAAAAGRTQAAHPRSPNRQHEDDYFFSRSMDDVDSDYGGGDGDFVGIDEAGLYHSSAASSSGTTSASTPAGDSNGPAHVFAASGSIAMQIKYRQQQQQQQQNQTVSPGRQNGTPGAGGGDNQSENSRNSNAAFAGPIGVDPREPSATRTPIKSPESSTAPNHQNGPMRQGLLHDADNDNDENDNDTDRYDNSNFFARSLTVDADGRRGNASAGSTATQNPNLVSSATAASPALGHRLDTAVRQQSELRRRKLILPRKSSNIASPNDNGSVVSANGGGGGGKIRKRGSWGNLRVLTKAPSSFGSGSGGGGSSVATSTSAGTASTSATSSAAAGSAFFTRSVRSVVDTLSGPAASMQSTARSAAAPMMGMSKKIVNAGKGLGMPLLSPTYSVQSKAAATPLPPEQDTGTSLATPRKDVIENMGGGDNLTTPRQANRKGNDQSDYGNEGDEPMRTPVHGGGGSASFLFSSPERLRPIGRVASAATTGLRQGIHSVSQSPAVTKAVLFSKKRGSEIMTKRRAKRAAAIKSRLARIERLKAEGKYNPIIIPADHPMKIAWDVLTIILTILSALRTHQSIRDRTYDQSPFVVFTEFWFILDIVLNFFCEHKTSSGEIIRDGKAVWARYLTTWFIIDALSVVPWERIYVKPIVEKQKRRNIFTKTFFRSKAVVRVTRILRGRHVKLFGRVAKQTKTVGVGGQRLLRLIIKYVPKYLLFYRNMRSVLVVRTLRQVHFLRKLWKSFVVSIRREPLVVLRRPGMVFAAASAEWTEEDDWDDDDDDDDDDHGLDDEDEHEEGDSEDDNSLLDRRGSKDSLVDFTNLNSDELDDMRRSNLFVEDDAGKVAIDKFPVLLPDLNDVSDDPPAAGTGGRSSNSHQQRFRSVSEGGDAFGNSITPSSSSGSLRMRRTDSKLGLNEEDEIFT